MVYLILIDNLPALTWLTDHYIYIYLYLNTIFVRLSGQLQKQQNGNYFKKYVEKLCAFISLFVMMIL